MKKFLGILIYTYNRVDDAKINMEIIRNIWAKPKLSVINKYYDSKYFKR